MIRDGEDRMDDATYWQLIDLLGGVAEESTVTLLEQELALRSAEDREEFLHRTQAFVDELLARCEVPPSHAGDTAEWIAAAVIARGRDTYEQTRQAGKPLVPGDWEWDDAEWLLVAGIDLDAVVPDSPEGIGNSGLVGLTWLASWAPEGLEQHVDDLHLDPYTYGFRPFPDPAWANAWEQLLTDEEVAPHLEFMAQWELRIAIIDGDDLELGIWPSPEQAELVQLMVPVALFRAEPSREEGYAKAVRTLLGALLDDSAGPGPDNPG